MRRDSLNPLLPSGFDIGWSIVGIVVAAAYVAFILAALWSIFSSRRLTGAGRLLWVLVVVAFPLLGSLAWFVWGRDARLDRGVL